MKKLIVCILLFGITGCDTLRDPVTANISAQSAFDYGGYCSKPPDETRSAASYVNTGFAYVEQQCGVFFDKLAEATQAGNFTHEALLASNTGAQSILQAAKVAAQKVTLVGSAITLSESLFDAFVKQYAFSSYLYKIRDLTFQALEQHTTDNKDKIQQLKASFSSNKSSPDDYCDAFVLVQQHARICTISSIQALFDQQVANATTVTNATTPKNNAKSVNLNSLNLTASPARNDPGKYIPPKAPNGYTVQ